MSHPIEQTLTAIGIRARRLLLAYASSWVVGATLVALLVVGGLDWLVRFSDPGIRWIASLAVLGTLGACIYWFMAPALTTRLGQMEVARRIERRFPLFNDRLASTVQFLSETENTPHAGSPALRRAVVVETTAVLERVKVDDVIEPRPVRRAATVAGVLVLLGALVAGLFPGATGLALNRLARPWADIPWPQRTHLAVRSPVTRLAQGDTFNVLVVDSQGAALPGEVRLHLRMGDGADAETEVVSMQYLPAESAMFFRKEGVRRPFAYWATGGDDSSMKEIELTVVEPPAPVELKLSLRYPAYTAWPDSPADRHIRALPGSRVALVGAATKPLGSARIALEDGRAFSARLSPDGYRFERPISDGPEDWIVQGASQWRLLLEDADGVVGGREIAYEVKAVPDAAPVVAVERPNNNIFVTPDAVISVVARVRDDVGLKSARILILREDVADGSPQSIPIYTGPENAAPPGAGFNAATFSGEERSLEHSLELAPLKLEPGSVRMLVVEAEDYFPQTGRSQPLRLTILTHRDLESQLQERQSLLLGELSRLLKMEQDARGQLRGVETQLDDVGALAGADVDQLEASAMAQQQVERGLVSKGEGVRGQLSLLKNDIEANRIDNPDLSRRIDEIGAEIDRLERDTLPPLEQSLSGAVKAAREMAGGGEKDPALGENLQQAGAGQDDVVASLERLVGELSRGAEIGRMVRDLTQLKNDQGALTREAGKTGESTAGKPAESLMPQERADLKKLSDRQRDLGRRFDKLVDRMSEMEKTIDANNPLAATALRDALDEAAKLAPSGTMAEAAGQLQKNQVGQAAATQEQATRQLQDVLDTLSSRKEEELSRLVRKLKDAEAEMGDLARKQESLRKRFAEAEKIQDPQEKRRELERLTREQKQLEQETQKLARKLERLQAEDAAKAGASASRKMGQAGDQGQAGDAGKAKDAAAAAEKDLEDAQQKLAERRQQAEADLLYEQLAKMQDALKALARRQEGLVAETERLEALREEQGRLTRAQAATALDLGQEQRLVSRETDELGKKVAAARIFKLALDAASREMLRAADLLAEQQTSDDTVSAQRSAQRRLEQMVVALEPPQAPPGTDSDGAGGDDGGGGGGSPEDAITNLAQLKLVELLQRELKERTAALHEKLDQRGDLTPAQRRELVDLAEEQGHLAEMLVELSEESSPPTDDAESSMDAPPGGEGSNEPADDENEKPTGQESR